MCGVAESCTIILLEVKVVVVRVIFVHKSRFQFVFDIRCVEGVL